MAGNSTDSSTEHNKNLDNDLPSPAHFRRMVELAGDVIYTTDRDGYFTYINPRVEALLNYKPEDMIGKNHLEFVAPTHRDRLKAFYREQFEQRIHETVTEFPAITNDSGEKWVEQIVILTIENDIPIGFQATVRDITPRKQAEVALHEERDLLRTLIDTIPDYIYVKDTAGRMLLNNVAHLCGLGVASQEEVFGKTAFDFYPQEIAQQFDAAEQKILQSGQAALHVEEQTEARWLSTSKVPLRNRQGEIYRIVGISRDITAYKRVEAELSKQLEQLTLLQRINRELMKTLNMEYVLEIAMDISLRLSHADVGFLGLVDDAGDMRVVKCVGDYPQSNRVPYTQSPEDIVSRVMRNRQPELVTDKTTQETYYSLIPNMRAQLALPLISQQRLLGVICLETHQPKYFTHQTVDFLHLVTGPIIVGIDNARLYALSQEQLAELKNLYAEVSRLEQLKSDMIRIAAHDLRNPIHVIRGYLSLLHKTIYDQLQPADQGRFDQIHTATERMEQIIADILSLQRIEQAAKGELVEQVNLTALIDEIVDEYRVQAEEKSLVLAHHLPDAALTVVGDAALLREAISNLVSNAIKYTPQNGHVIMRLKQSTSVAVFEVKDTGYGIPDEMQGKLFQPFYRAITDDTANIEGTGLGLHLVKNIIERHQGNIIFNSVYGEGSIFGFVLPLATE
ncbi:MAG: hypothetical protein CUN54_02770 [Phototrophicales bacterium]|nr:MAG: hypothetical protein CUN54_02770 [Phototrophicales bacterium]